MDQSIKPSEALSLFSSLALEGSERVSPKKEKQVAMLRQIAQRHLPPVSQAQQFRWDDMDKPDGLPPKAMAWMMRPGLADPKALTEESRYKALKQYKLSTAGALNNALRQGTLTELQQKSLREIEGGLADLNANGYGPSGQILLRGLKRNCAISPLHTTAEGKKKFTDPALMSTTIVADVGKYYSKEHGVILHIAASAQKGADISRISPDAEQCEILMQKGIEYDILSMKLDERNRLFKWVMVDAELPPQHGSTGAEYLLADDALSIDRRSAALHHLARDLTSPQFSLRETHEQSRDRLKANLETAIRSLTHDDIVALVPTSLSDDERRTLAAALEPRQAQDIIDTTVSILAKLDASHRLSNKPPAELLRDRFTPDQYAEVRNLIDAHLPDYFKDIFPEELARLPDALDKLLCTPVTPDKVRDHVEEILKVVGKTLGYDFHPNNVVTMKAALQQRILGVTPDRIGNALAGHFDQKALDEVATALRPPQADRFLDALRGMANTRRQPFLLKELDQALSAHPNVLQEKLDIIESQLKAHPELNTTSLRSELKKAMAKLGPMAHKDEIARIKDIVARHEPAVEPGFRRDSRLLAAMRKREARREGERMKMEAEQQASELPVALSDYWRYYMKDSADPGVGVSRAQGKTSQTINPAPIENAAVPLVHGDAIHHVPPANTDAISSGNADTGSANAETDPLKRGKFKRLKRVGYRLSGGQFFKKYAPDKGGRQEG